MTASVSGDRYVSNDVNHSVGPALIDEEIDDSVDLTPGDKFHHIALFIWDDGKAVILTPMHVNDP